MAFTRYPQGRGKRHSDEDGEDGERAKQPEEMTKYYEHVDSDNNSTGKNKLCTLYIHDSFYKKGPE
ncbi:unnamed protein product, partial [Trichobilharzia szidati]